MAWQCAFILLALVAAVSALAAPATHTVHEEQHEAPARWVKRDRVPSFANLPVRIGLTQSNLDSGPQYLMDIAHPASRNYGKHWTAEQVIDAFKPSEETLEAVRTWLVDSGIEGDSITLSKNQAWFAFHATAEQMESLLHTEYFEYQDQHTGGVMPACERYHVPRHIRQHIDYITPGVKLLAPLERPKEQEMLGLAGRQLPNPSERQGGSRSFDHDHRLKRHQSSAIVPRNNLTECDQVVTPACIAALYHVPEPAPPAIPGNSMGIFEAELQAFDQQDLNAWFKQYADWIPEGTHPHHNDVDGGVAVAGHNLPAREEVMLDLEMAYPIVYPQTITIWNVDDLHYQAWKNNTYTWGFNTLLDAIDGSYCTSCAYGECGDLTDVDPTYPDPSPNGYKGKLQCGMFKPTNVISLSYGGQEADVPVAYQKRQCNEYLKLGLQGVSFFFASGDAGVGNGPKRHGKDSSPGCLGPKNNIFNPTWPNNCPWITNVGATEILPGKTVFDPESAASQPLYGFSSGGGFSNVYAVPAYQKVAVDTFFADHKPPYASYSGLAADSSDVYAKPKIAALAGNSGGIYNRIGRGIPDVAAVGLNGAIHVNGLSTTSGGTSMSTPIFAAIINRINEERIAAGKTAVGFINPTLYEHPEILNDITNGTNPGCGTEGFSAVKGWDPVTGLGTPNYPKMLKLFMSLP